MHGSMGQYLLMVRSQ